MVVFKTSFCWLSGFILFLFLGHVSAVWNPDTPGLQPHQRRALRDRPLYKRQVKAQLALKAFLKDLD